MTYLAAVLCWFTRVRFWLAEPAGDLESAQRPGCAAAVRLPRLRWGHLRTIRDHDVDPPAWRVPAHLCAGSGRGLAPVGWTTERRV